LKKLLFLLVFVSSTLCHGTEDSFFKKLFKTMHITGYGYGIYSDAGIIYNSHRPCFTVHFGEDQHKQYQLDFTSWGITAQLSYSASLLLFVNTDPDFYNTHKRIKLGWGVSGEFYWPHRSYRNFLAQMVGIDYGKKINVEVGAPLEHHSSSVAVKGNCELSAKIDFSPIKKILGLPNLAVRITYINMKKGGIILLSLSPGITVAPLNGGLSVITGGTITPLNK
jgi:hypothetical protein